MSKNNKNEKDKKNYEARIITLGGGSVGKTSLILRYVDDFFALKYVQTVGIDTKIKIVKLENGEEIKVILADTAGQERYNSLAANYVIKVDGILLVYDITKEKTFKEVKKWAQNIKEEYGNSKPIILIGNKSDLSDERCINKENGEDFADTFLEGVKYYETSFKTGDNVEEAINDLVKQIFKLNYGVDPGEMSKDKVKLTYDKKRKKGKQNCC